ncbi:MAG: carboxypeptidase-like regulatory domain-containing protein [Flavobacteriales bacterium]
MKKEYQIKHPCKKYNLKAKADNINFSCESCNKNVKDLTRLDSYHLFKQIKKEVNTCVKIRSSQLSLMNQFVLNTKKAMFYGSAFVLLTTSCNPSIIKNFGEDYGRVLIDADSEKKESLSRDEVKGKLVDVKSGESIPFASISIESHHFVTSTDVDGNFSFIIPENIAMSSKIQFNTIGFHILEIEIGKIVGKHIVVNLGEEKMVIGYLELLPKQNQGKNG